MAVSEDMQIGTIQPGTSRYPESLNRILHPTVLHTIGNVDLLGQTSIGISGSRNASQEALEYAYQFGVQAAQQGVVVISGYAKGVDRHAHLGALRAGGDTIAVLPEGIRRFRLVRELWDATGDEDMRSHFLAVSMFDTTSPWAVWRAMKRNKLIVGLSVALFIMEARAKGGTMNAAEECLRQKKPLWVVDYTSDGMLPEGNRILLKRGASPVREIEGIARAIDLAVSVPTLSERQGILL